MPAAGVAVDVAFGGAIYAFVPAARFGLRVVPEDLPALIDAGRAVKRALDGSVVARHPADERLSGLYGTVPHEQVGERRTTATSRSSPTARSTARPPARPRRRAPRCSRRGRPGGRAPRRNDSVVGTTFHARVVGRVPEGVLTEVEGTAFRTGEHRFVLDPRDPLGTGFVLR